MIETLYHEKQTMGSLLHHDWQDHDEFIEAYKTWIELKTSIRPDVICHERRSNIAHRRLLTLNLASGQELRFKFDQGVGYWQISEENSRFSTVKYNFHSDLWATASSITSDRGSVVG